MGQEAAQAAVLAPAWPRPRLAGLLAPALADDTAAACKAAESALAAKAGVPLIHRWAKLVADGKRPSHGEPHLQIARESNAAP